MRKEKFKNLIRVTLAAALLVCCCFSFCACHVFAWYIPKPYNDKQMKQIYDKLKDGLDKLEPILASVGLEQDGLGYYYNVFREEGKIIIRYDAYKDADAVKRGLYYDGTLKEWDVESRTETAVSKDVSEYDFLFKRIDDIAEYFKNEVLDVMPYREDSYCWQCFPWDVGMAQMYYLPDDANVGISASWTIEENYDSKKFPLIFEAQYHYDSKSDSVWLTTHSEPYGIDERITNIIANYEQDKQRDEIMLNEYIYVKISGGETLQMCLYNNDAVKALLGKLADGDVTLTLNDYGDIEKVGDLGFELPSNDEQYTATPLDVMLYQGDKLVIFYGQNTYSYTQIGHLAGYSDDLFKDVIKAGQGEITVTLTLNRD